MYRIFLLLSLICFVSSVFGQGPSYGPEIPVTIQGWDYNAMEPFISPDGNALFFNSLNNGINTAIYYSGKVNDSTFTLVGAFPIVNQLDTPRLDGVASMDVHENFYWVSTRDYPAEYENLHHVTFDSIGYSNFGRVHGDFNINGPGWIIMDAAIDHDGEYLYYCNANFSTCGAVPCFSKIGIAQKANDSTFNKLINTDAIMANINDTLNYIIYAPAITPDGLELFYTRAPIAGTTTEMLVATRPNVGDPFGLPVLLDDTPYLPEGPTLTTDKNVLYYHKKIGIYYQIYMRYRTADVGIEKKTSDERIFLIHPNPTNSEINISWGGLVEGSNIHIRNMSGNLVYKAGLSPNQKKLNIDVSLLAKGWYIVQIGSNTQKFNKK